MFVDKFNHKSYTTEIIQTCYYTHLNTVHIKLENITMIKFYLICANRVITFCGRLYLLFDICF